MTARFRHQLPALLLISHLLASLTTATSWQPKEQRKSNRQRSPTTTANDFPTNETTVSPELPKSTIAAGPLHRLETVPMDWYFGYDPKKTVNKSARRIPPKRKAGKSHTTREPLRGVTATPVGRTRARSTSSASVTDRVVAPQSVYVPPSSRVPVEGYPSEPRNRSRAEDRETNGRRHRNPRVGSTSPTAAATSDPTTVQSVQSSLIDTTATTTTTTTTAATTTALQTTTTTTTTANPPTTKSNESSGSKSSPGEDRPACRDACDMSLCPLVEAESCRGRVIKDRCKCCPVCLLEPSAPAMNYSADGLSSTKPLYYPSNACSGMVCTKYKTCILNIQGIPMCRCPNIYACRNGERNLLCAQNGHTYKNKCFLKVDECTAGRRIRVLHKGACRSPRPAAPTNAPAAAAAAAQGPLNRAPPSPVAPAHVNAAMKKMRKAGGKKKSKVPAGNNWRPPVARDETRAHENRHRKRFGGRPID